VLVSNRGGRSRHEVVRPGRWLHHCYCAKRGDHLKEFRRKGIQGIQQEMYEGLLHRKDEFLGVVLDWR